MQQPHKASTTNTFSQSKDLPEDQHNDITKLYIPIIKRLEVNTHIKNQSSQNKSLSHQEEKPNSFHYKTYQNKNFTKLDKTKIAEKSQKTEVVETCNCVRSNCLKLYCVCFSSGNLCGNSCLCRNCKNSHDNMERSQAIIQIIEKDAHAFSKINKSSTGKTVCNCKRSNCLKNYCQCYKNGSSCGPDCFCFDCKNNKIEEDKKPRRQNFLGPKLDGPLPVQKKNTGQI